MEYFECDTPHGDGLCSDRSCPCPEVKIPRGTGYLFIEPEIVEFRRKYPRTKDALEAKKQEFKTLYGGMDVGGMVRIGPILVCEQGAKLRGLDLEAAAEDARYWWKHGKVPLRPTPIAKDAGRRSAAPAVEDEPPPPRPKPKPAPARTGPKHRPADTGRSPLPDDFDLEEEPPLTAGSWLCSLLFLLMLTVALAAAGAAFVWPFLEL